MKNIIIGMAVGDAVGVPYEFIYKDVIKLDPCIDMIGHGTHNQPKGTWSDDTSMALCVVDSLKNGLNYSDMADKFSKWLYGNLWTPHGKVFDNGFSTKRAIDKWIKGETSAFECGGKSINTNGNGSVMRTLALVPFLEGKDILMRYEIVSKVSSITHAHWISRLSCFLVCEYAIAIREGFDKYVSFDIAVGSVNTAVEYINMRNDDEISDDEFKEVFGELFELIKTKPSNDLFSGSGYARDTAMTSIWCILTTNTYKEAVLKAVNYGDDTDTTACVTGGLGGVIYGVDGIPEDWVNSLARKDDIIELVEQYEATYENV